MSRVFPGRKCLLSLQVLACGLLRVNGAGAQTMPTAAGFGAELCPPGACAAADTDGDGVFDEFDVCPTQRETPNDFEDGDGCPDQRGAVPNEVTRQVLFQSGSHRLTRASAPTLRQMAALVRGSQSSLRYELVGFADERGSKEANQQLSQQRADAVLSWLVAHGASKNHLRAVGQGEVAGNRVGVMRENRRVEMRAVSPTYVRSLENAADMARQPGVLETINVNFRSGWAIIHSGDVPQLRLSSPSGASCPVYSIVRHGERTAVYARCVSGLETDMIVERRPGRPAHAFFLKRTPPPEGALSLGSVLQRWEDWELDSTTPTSPLSGVLAVTPVIVARGQNHPGAIATYGTTVYVAVDGAIVQIPKEGGPPKPLVPGVKATSLTVDGSHLYWVDGEKVMRAYKDGGIASTWASGQKGASNLAIHNNYVYWVNTVGASDGGPNISRERRQGNHAVVVASAESPRRAAVNDSGVFYLSSTRGTVVGIPYGKTTPVNLATDQHDATDIAVDDSFVYWVGASGVRKVPLTGGTIVSLSSTPGRRLVLDDSHVFWVVGQASAPGGDGVARVPKAGGHVGVIPSEGVMDLAVDDSRVYWTRAGLSVLDGAVLALPKH